MTLTGLMGSLQVLLSKLSVKEKDEVHENPRRGRGRGRNRGSGHGNYRGKERGNTDRNSNNDESK